MNFLTYIALRCGVFLILMVVTSPVIGLLVLVGSLMDQSDKLHALTFVVVLLVLLWFVGLGWLVQQTTNRMMFENKTLFQGVKESLIYARLCLSFVPVVGRWFELKDSDENENRK
jgi:uncharacterized membrane protein YqjE